MGSGVASFGSRALAFCEWPRRSCFSCAELQGRPAGVKQGLGPITPVPSAPGPGLGAPLPHLWGTPQLLPAAFWDPCEPRGGLGNPVWRGLPKFWWTIFRACSSAGAEPPWGLSSPEHLSPLCPEAPFSLPASGHFLLAGCGAGQGQPPPGLAGACAGSESPGCDPHSLLEGHCSFHPATTQAWPSATLAQSWHNGQLWPAWLEAGQLLSASGRTGQPPCLDPRQACVPPARGTHLKETQEDKKEPPLRGRGLEVRPTRKSGAPATKPPG